MSYTEYIDHTSGLTLYAKAKPLNATWATGIVTMSENGSTGEYSSSSFSDGVEYSVFVNANGTPGNEASSDTKIATISPSAATIIAALSATATTLTSVVDSSTIEIVNPDHYDGTAGNLLTWTTTKDYTTATSVKLVIYDKDTPATVLKTAPAVVASSTSITVDLDVDFGSSLTFAGCPLTAHCGFALVADLSGEAETIARGDCYVYNRGIPA